MVAVPVPRPPPCGTITPAYGTLTVGFGTAVTVQGEPAVFNPPPEMVPPAAGLQVTLQQRLAPLAAGLTARSVLETFAAMQMVDTHLPTTDGKEFLLSRYTAPGREQQLLLTRLDLQLPPQPQPELNEALPPPAAVTL